MTLIYLEIAGQTLLMLLDLTETLPDMPLAQMATLSLVRITIAVAIQTDNMIAPCHKAFQLQ
jgi:hypothetical protein